MKKVLRYSLYSFLLLIAVLLTYNYWPQTPLPEGSKIDRIVVEKGERVMHVYEGDRLLKSYPISLGFAPEGQKEKEGDGKTPEGFYTINDKNPNSGYFLNLGVSYPLPEQRQKAQAEGINPGGDIKIHGMTNGLGAIGKLQRFTDWTAGCIAVTNTEMQELFDYVPIGTVIEIRK